ncbi:MAG TPA: alpha-hydroxy-acid oxidizing protein [Paenirhodobacter sp.]
MTEAVSRDDAPTRRDIFKLAGAGVAAATVISAKATPAFAQVAEEVNTPTLTLARKGIDKALDVINVDYLEEAVNEVYTEGVRVFVMNGSGKQWTLAENQRAWGDYVFTPHRLSGLGKEDIDLSIDLLGLKLPHPFIITPFGSHGIHHPLAEVATAIGGAQSGALSCYSSASTSAMEEITKASDAPKFFQIYLDVDDGKNQELLVRAKGAGFKGIVFTMDSIAQSSSDEYVRLGKNRPWLPYGNFDEGKSTKFKINLGWSDVGMIAKASGLPVVVKGITRAEDALKAIESGASAIQVSNHGGRSLDGTPATISVLPEIADAVQGKAPVIFDSGIRRGTDVVKALALGADAVAIGRPVMYGLALGGASGVDSVLSYFHRETVEVMVQCGARSVAELDRTHVRRV